MIDDWGVSLAKMSNYIVMSNKKVFIYKKKSHMIMSLYLKNLMELNLGRQNWIK